MTDERNHAHSHRHRVGGARSTAELLPLVYQELRRFAGLEPQQAELVKLRYFVGLKTEEAAEVLGVSKATAKRWWAYVRAWLFHETRADSSGIRPDSLYPLH